MAVELLARCPSAPFRAVDGRAKVTGAAQYAAEFPAEGLLHGVVHTSRIAKGRIESIDTAAALAVPGVVEVLTHENRPSTSLLRYSYKDQVAPPGSPFAALYDVEIRSSGQPIALVLAESFEIARAGLPGRIAQTEPMGRETLYVVSTDVGHAAVLLEQIGGANCVPGAIDSSGPLVAGEGG